MGPSPKKLVYVAGPLTVGDKNHNLRRAVAAGDMIYAMGGVPLIPHLALAWENNTPRNYSYEEWMGMDLELIRRCDALYRLPGESPGADREVEWAKSLAIKVFDGADRDVSLEAFLAS